jgi:hypothetical protein
MLYVSKCRYAPMCIQSHHAMLPPEIKSHANMQNQASNQVPKNSQTLGFLRTMPAVNVLTPWWLASRTGMGSIFAFLRTRSDPRS